MGYKAMTGQEIRYFAGYLKTESLWRLRQILIENKAYQRDEHVALIELEMIRRGYPNGE